MGLQNALKCITNSNSIKKLDATINLTNNIESDELDEIKIDWSKLGVLDVESSAGNYIDKISNFDGILTLKSAKINSLSGNLENLSVLDEGSPSIYFEDGTYIKSLSFYVPFLQKEGYNPYVETAFVMQQIKNSVEGGSTESLAGFLSNTKNILCEKNLYYPYFTSLGYLTMTNGFNINWAKISVEGGSHDIQEKSLVRGTSFYNNLIFYVTNNKLNTLTLDYIDGIAIDEDKDGYENIVIPAAIPNEYISAEDASQLNIDTVNGIPVILGDYCFGGIGSTDKGGKDKHLYLTFDNTFIFNDSTTTTSDDGVVTETMLSTAPFTENTFLTRYNAVQQVNINLREKRPDDDLDTQSLYFSDFFTTCVKTKTTTTVDNGDGTSNTTENVETTFEFDEDAFNSCKDKLIAMVGSADNLIFESPYQDIVAYIDVDAEA